MWAVANDAFRFSSGPSPSEDPNLFDAFYGFTPRLRIVDSIASEQ